jgi:radical SAM protein with 4Fe4S-binding SPASM domain
MCYEWGDHGAYVAKTDLRRLRIDVVKRVIDECKPARPYYDLYGGEPLLYPRFEHVLEAIQSAGSEVQFPTNGTLLEKRAELLVGMSVHRIWVSLDGPPQINDRQRGSGVFERAVAGMRKVRALRERQGTTNPQVCVEAVVTPATYRFLEEFFFESLDLTLLDGVSIELQTYLSREAHQEYKNVLGQEFGTGPAPAAPIAAGFIADPAGFAGMDFALLARQVARIASYCNERGIFMNTFPRKIDENSLRRYFSMDRPSMPPGNARCSYPWVSTEINARGDVTSCHAFYDLTLGNVYESSIVDIWRGARYKQYRDYLRAHMLPICKSCMLFYEGNH